jgi:hypothetical protein
MIMRAPVRRLALVAHIICSVGWIGAVAVSLVLALVGLAASDGRLVQAVYLILPVVGWSVLVPLSALSLTTGVVQALGTNWGLVRHYWVVVKLVMNVLSTTILLLYMQTLTLLATDARAWTGGNPGPMRSPSPVLHASLAMVLLMVAAVLSVYKPAGQTGLGTGRARVRSIEGKYAHADRPG